MHADKQSAGGTVLVVVLVLWVANYGWVQWQGYPFAYCWGVRLLTPLEELYRLSFWVVLAVFVFHLQQQRWASAFASALVIGLVAGIPTFADAAFRLGRACT